MVGLKTLSLWMKTLLPLNLAHGTKLQAAWGTADSSSLLEVRVMGLWA
jgi:hypothetical protein